MDFENFLNEYLARQKKTCSIIYGYNEFMSFNLKYKRKETYTFYLSHLKTFVFDFCSYSDITTFSQITNQTIDSYLYFLKSRNLCNATINKKISCVKVLMHYLKSINMIEFNSLVFPHLEETPKEINTISLNDLEKLLIFVGSKSLKEQIICYLLLSTGIRRKELVNIKVKFIDYEKKRIFLETTKTNKPRYVYLDSYLIPLIKKLVLANKQKIYLFENRNHDCLSPTYITQLFYFYKKSLGIVNLSPHKLRHTFATLLLKNGANIEEVRRLLGHTDYKMTKRYLDFVDNDLQNACEKYNPFSQLHIKSPI